MKTLLRLGIISILSLTTVQILSGQDIFPCADTDPCCATLKELGTLDFTITPTGVPNQYAFYFDYAEGNNLIYNHPSCDAIIIDRWKWDFGDGNTTLGGDYPSGNPILHTFLAPVDCSSDFVFDISLCVRIKGGGSEYSCVSSQTLVIPGSLTNPDYTINATPGTCGQYSFSYTTNGQGIPLLQDPQWSFGDGYLGSGPSQNHTYNNNGTYVIVLTDGSVPGFCPIVTTVTINANPAIDFTFQANCNNLNAQFSISGYNGGSGYSYLWDFAGTLQPASGSSESHTFSSPGNQIVQLTVTDPAGCSNTVSKYVQVGGPDASFSAISPVCLNQPLTVYSLSGGGTFYEWAIKPPGGTSFTPIGNSYYPNYIFTAPGTYEVQLTIQSGNACPDAIHTETVVVEAAPSGTLSAQLDICASEAIITPSVSGSVGSYTIDFGDGNTQSGNSLPTDWSHTYASAGTYQVQLSLASPDGCTEELTEAVVVAAPPSLSLYPANPTICFDGQVNLQALVLNGGGSLTYSWTLDGNQLANTGNVVTATQPGVYAVSVQPLSCTSPLTASTTVTQLPTITATEGSVTGATCLGNNDGSITLNNLPPQAYALNNGPTQTSSTQSLTGLSPGLQYIKIAYDALPSCYTILTVNVPDNSPQLSTTATPSRCDNPTGEATVTVSGGAVPFTYEWWQVLNPGTVLGTGATLSGQAPGNYVVAVTDGNGCTVTATVEIPEVIVNLSLQNAPLATCASGNLPITVLRNYNIPNPPGGSFTWQVGTASGNWVTVSAGTSNSFTFSPGTYRVRYSDYYGCSDDLVFEIEELDDLSASLQIDQPNCSGQTATAQVIVSGGTGAYSYQWSNSSSTGSTASGLSPGNFSVTVQDVPGCATIASGNIAPLSSNLIQFVEAEITGCDLKVEVTGGVGPYQYEWYIEEEITTYAYVIVGGDTLQTIATGTSTAWHYVHSHSGQAIDTTTAANFQTGDYQLVVTDTYGCQLVYDPIYLEVPVDTMLPFSFVWSKEELPEEPTKVIDPIIRENMAEASNSLFNAMDNCVLQEQRALAANVARNCQNLDSLRDQFTLSYDQNIHHYTLYYYDRAGNLVKTVPPQGIELLDDTEIAQVKTFRKNGQGTAPIPDHRMTTRYAYNSLGQLIHQYTPDGDTTRFLYDALSRLRLSENAQQRLEGRYSYTKYDTLGRINEVGESVAPGPDFQWLNNPANHSLVFNASFPTSNNAEITHTVYTEPALVDYYGQNQRYLQNRVSYVWHDEDGDVTTLQDRRYTYYSYDLHGNVEWLIQEDPVLGKMHLGYEYDLISGNVLKVKYNEYHQDRFFHRYAYDPENRITQVQTSRDGYLWETDARYDYFRHGPLRRTVLGEDHVQGIDYAYTIHGWLKGINTPHLDSTDDPGEDGMSIANLTDTPTDRFGMSLGYYEGDFVRNNSFLNKTLPLYAATNAAARDLYNGNIGHWTNSQIVQDATQLGGVRVDSTRVGIYTYDLLNRIRQSQHAYAQAPASLDNWWATSNSFGTTYRYGANGNLTELSRRTGDGTLMDELSYTYDNGAGNVPLENNRLQAVEDLATGHQVDGWGDLEETHTYTYDAIGNLTQDIGKERLDLDNGSGYQLYDVTLNMDWTVYGKVRSVEKLITGQGMSRRDSILFFYSPNGDRTEKRFLEDRDNSGSVDETETTTTYYVRDAQGNMLAVYERRNEIMGADYEAVFTLIEQPIYGSDRLGVSNRRMEIARVPYTLGESIALDLPADGILERSEYQNWITTSNRALLNNTICAGRITTIDFDADNAQQYASDSDLSQFIGVAGNGVAVAENLVGELQFYVVLAENYLGVQDACLVFDRNGMLMQGTENISGAYPLAKPIVIQYPGTAVYAIVTLNTAGQPEYHTVDLAAVGYGTAADPLGAVLTQNQLIDAMPQATYGYHFAGYEDHVNSQSIVYHSRYEADLADPQQGSTAIMAYVFGGVPGAPPSLQVLHTVAGYGSTERGELQISANGNELSWYQHDLPVSAFAHRTFKLHLLPLAADHISLLGTPLVLNGSPAGNYGEGNLEWRDGNLLYSQRGVYLENGSDKNIFELDRLSGTILPTNTNSADYLYHEIKRGADGRFYVPRKTDPATDLLTFDGSVSTEPIFANPATWELASSLPTQVYKRSLLPAPDTGYVRQPGLLQYQLTDHLGNVRTLVSDLKLSELNAAGSSTVLMADVRGYDDYYPFGMGMQERKYDGGSGFRFGFQGMEKDGEVKGSGNSYTTILRQNDSRIGKWLSVDPETSLQPWSSSYVSMGNNPIARVDPLGNTDTGYTIDDTGKIEEVDDTGGDKYDVLWEKNEYQAGNKNYDYEGTANTGIRINDKSFIPTISKPRDGLTQEDWIDGEIYDVFYASIKGKDQAMNVFKFLSDATSLAQGRNGYNGFEWSLLGKKDGSYNIGTTKSWSQGISFSKIDGFSDFSQYSLDIHSHPGFTWDSFNVSGPDHHSAGIVREQNPNAKFFIYVPELTMARYNQLAKDKVYSTHGKVNSFPLMQSEPNKLQEY